MSNQSKNVNKPFILVDGSAYLFRAFHALPPLVTTKGEPTGAIYGVVSNVRKLLADYDLTYIAVTFDTKEPTFRDELYPQYKIHRKETPSELISQFCLSRSSESNGITGVASSWRGSG